MSIKRKQIKSKLEFELECITAFNNKDQGRNRIVVSPMWPGECVHFEFKKYGWNCRWMKLETLEEIV